MAKLQIAEIDAIAGKVSVARAGRIPYVGVSQEQNYRKLLNKILILPAVA